MTTSIPRNPNYVTQVQASFDRQRLMATLGARLLRVQPGEVSIELPYDDRLSQQHGYTHAGAITSAVDSACGYAALSLMPEGYEVLTIEYKVNFINPAKGERFEAVGRVVKSGRTISVCQGEVVACDGPNRVTIAIIQASMLAVVGQ